MFSSPKGGVGKTTIAAHVAAISPGVVTRWWPSTSIHRTLCAYISVKPSPTKPDPCDLRRSEWRASLVETRYGVDLLPYGATEPFDVVRLNAALTANPALIKAPMQTSCAILTQSSSWIRHPVRRAVASVAGLADLVVVVLLADAGSACLMPDLMSGRAFGSGTIGARTSRRA